MAGKRKEFLQENFPALPGLNELAKAVGVHPTHLARVFREFEIAQPEIMFDKFASKMREGWYLQPITFGWDCSRHGLCPTKPTLHALSDELPEWHRRNFAKFSNHANLVPVCFFESRLFYLDTIKIKPRRSFWFYNRWFQMRCFRWVK